MRTTKAVLVLSILAAFGCDGPAGEDAGDCAIGAEGCACTQGGFCDEPLMCTQGVCVAVDNEDAGAGLDAGSGGSPDAAVPGDAGMVRDGGIVDASFGGPDAGGLDAGKADAGQVDAGALDAGGPNDGGVLDAGGVQDAGGAADGGPDAGGAPDAGAVCTEEPPPVPAPSSPCGSLAATSSTVIQQPANSRLRVKVDSIGNDSLQRWAHLWTGCSAAGDTKCSGKAITWDRTSSIGASTFTTFRYINVYNFNAEPLLHSVYKESSVSLTQALFLNGPLGPPSGDVLPVPETACESVPMISGSSGTTTVPKLDTTSLIDSKVAFPDCDFWFGETDANEGLVSIVLEPHQRIIGSISGVPYPSSAILRPGCPLRLDSCVEAFDDRGGEPIGADNFTWVNTSDAPEEIWILLESSGVIVNGGFTLGWDLYDEPGFVP